MTMETGAAPLSPILVLGMARSRGVLSSAGERLLLHQREVTATVR
jgi:hypothetical protein